MFFRAKGRVIPPLIIPKRRSPAPEHREQDLKQLPKNFQVLSLAFAFATELAALLTSRSGHQSFITKKFCALESFSINFFKISHCVSVSFGE